MVADIQALHSQNEEIQRMEQIFQAQKEAFARHPYPGAEERIDHLNRLRPLLLKYQDEICDALNNDFGGRSADETRLAEILTSLEGVGYYAKNLRKWMKPQKRKVGAAQWPGSAMVTYQPVGVVGIISPWNYPFYLALGPMIGALAAGNRVMIKMSESTPASGALLRKILAEVYEQDHVAVFNGEVDVGAAFSKLPFDHLLFTGATSIGRHVMRAAAENLTPVTLELGGKSPCIISDDFPIPDAVERIAFGKCFNAGQTCVSPDYVMLPKGKTDEFVKAFNDQVSGMYPTMLNNPDLTSVVNERQHKRLIGYIEDAREKGATVIQINPANEDFSQSRKIPFTLLLNVTADMKVADDEIFGPLMIVHEYDSVQQAIDFVNAGPRPLALYYFDWNSERARYVLNNTHSGCAALNDTMTQVGVDDIPFGGVGPSGMGHYHGYEGFLTFSNAKGVFRRGRINPTKNVLPPFGRGMHKFIYKYLMK
ncbi:coniferyl aldehyde dehydrogenase [Alcanivorax sp. 1008]|uniref:coniferyl aldehyde dehydrogenase n=1 Tax=Alcanivorax sp. 1008 TaxID=2816853 RepID=UPI001D1C5FAF|nr:coniferyl aldehyde dehydrogenase [Alcanivorax sp. 1008]MCC1496922.1 coniferyl aldehyde dehydrogenase [Alcanivorax sp. 1008]